MRDGEVLADGFKFYTTAALWLTDRLELDDDPNVKAEAYTTGEE